MKYAFVIVAILAIILLLWLNDRPRSFIGVGPLKNCALSVWWSVPEALPPWASYDFDLSNKSELIPATCSAVVRTVRNGEPQLAMFVGRGSEHPNMLLCAVGSKLVNVADRAGLYAIPNAQAIVYCCLAFDQADRGYDDLLIGRADGIWHLRASLVKPISLGFGSIVYSALKIAESSGRAPVAMSLSEQMDEASLIERSSTFVDLSETARVWASFYVAPTMLRTRGSYLIPTAGALTAIVTIGSQTWYGADGQFSTVAPSAAVVGRTATYEQRNYEWSLGSCEPLVVEEAPTKMPVFGGDQEAIGGSMRDAPSTRDHMWASDHITARPGAVDSDGMARPAEVENMLVARKARVPAAAVIRGQKIRIALIFVTPYSGLANNKIGSSTLLKYLTTRKSLKFTVAAPALGGCNVMVSQSADRRAIARLDNTKTTVVQMSVPLAEWNDKPMVKVGECTLTLDRMTERLLMRPTLALL